jgi:hypothetical protein
VKAIHVGTRVRIADTATLGAALRRLSELRPEPGQMVHAGLATAVTGYRRGAGDQPLFELDGAPGLWATEWLVPLA